MLAHAFDVIMPASPNKISYSNFDFHTKERRSRNDYSAISNLAKETKEAIYITKNGEGDMIFMSIDAFEKREQILQLRAKVQQAEQERINGEETLSISEARRRLSERADEV